MREDRATCGPVVESSYVSRIRNAAPEDTPEWMVEKLTEARKARSLASLEPAGAVEIGAANSADPEPGEPAIIETDVTIVGDLRSMREPGWEVAQQIRIQAAAGYRTALVHVPSCDTGSWHLINPEIQECVREGLAVPVDPRATLVKSALLILRQPHAVLDGVGRSAETPVPKVLARTTFVIADSVTLQAEATALASKDRLLRSLFGDLRWTASRRSTLDRLRSIAPSLEFDDVLWPDSLDIRPAWSRCPSRQQFIAGRVCGESESEWPDDPNLNAAIYPTGHSAQFRVLCLPRLGRMPFPTPPENWDFFRASEISWQKFLRGLDFFIYYPGARHIDLPLTALRWAMAHGVVAILPPELEPAVGEGPLYLSPDRVIPEAHRLHGDRAAYEALASQAKRHIRQNRSPDRLTSRLEQLVGPAPAAPPSRRTKSQRILFISSNGVGIGHLTRLLAIARRMPPEIEPVFATMSQAVSIVEQCGFPAEYIPSQLLTHGSNQLWNAWLTQRLDQLLRFYGASHIVFDGNHAYSGLIKAAATRSDCRLIWIRRGMWRPGQAHEPFIGRQKFFDLVLEPEDIASSRDLGATIDHRGRVATIPPIRFLDPEEVLSREDAAAKIGLDPARPSVLVQLGSGANRDIVSLVDQILSSAERFPDLQVVVAEWLMSHNSFSFWPKIKRLRGFPLSRYFTAFDFTITAAGYNSFNEVLSFGLPAIFSANTHASMDDQSARAAFAEEQGAAFCWKKGDRDNLDPLLDALMDADIRRTLKVNALRISRPNGADDAVSAIVGLVDEAPTV